MLQVSTSQTDTQFTWSTDSDVGGLGRGLSAVFLTSSMLLVNGPCFM